MEVIDYADRVPAEAWWLREDLWEHLSIKRPVIIQTKCYENWQRNDWVSFWPAWRGAGGFAMTVIT